MASSRLDPTPWNLGVPVLLAASCGPPIIFDETATDSNASTIGTSPEEGEVGPSTSPSTTVSSTQPVDCYSDDQCPPNYDCVDGHCYYGGYCDDDDYCCYSECCGPECGWYYDCYSNSECAVGYACNYGSCQPVETEQYCDSPAFFELPIPNDGNTRSLAFVDSPFGGQDLLLARADGVYRVAANDLAPVRIGGELDAYDVEPGDLDADGDPDLVVATSIDGNGEVTVLMNDGAWTPVAIAGLPSYGGVAVGDIEGDGFPDIWSFGAYGVYVAFNWSGKWSGPQYVLDSAFSLSTGDLDGDGFEDAVAHNYYTYAMWGGAALQVAQLSNARYFSTAKVVAVGELDGVSPVDVVSLEPLDSSGTTLVTTYQGTSLYNAGYDSWWPQYMGAVTTADMNLDGYDDIVAGSINYVLGVGYGGSSTPPDLVGCVGFWGTSYSASMIAAGDFDDSGRPDVAISDGYNVVVYMQSG